MNRSDLVRKVHDAVTRANGRGTLSAQAVSDLVDAVFMSMKDGLATEGTLHVRSFGTFSVVTAAPRKGRNPHSGEMIPIPERNRIVFRPAKQVRERLNAGGAARIGRAQRAQA